MGHLGPPGDFAMPHWPGTGLCVLAAWHPPDKLPTAVSRRCNQGQAVRVLGLLCCHAKLTTAVV